MMFIEAQKARMRRK